MVGLLAWYVRVTVWPGALKTPPRGGENARVSVWVESAGWLVGRMMLARW
jgi:hypothetical protein